MTDLAPLIRTLDTVPEEHRDGLVYQLTEIARIMSIPIRDAAGLRHDLDVARAEGEQDRLLARSNVADANADRNLAGYRKRIHRAAAMIRNDAPLPSVLDVLENRPTTKQEEL